MDRSHTCSVRDCTSGEDAAITPTPVEFMIVLLVRRRPTKMAFALHTKETRRNGKRKKKKKKKKKKISFCYLSKIKKTVPIDHRINNLPELLPSLLFTQEIPNWYCPRCACQICGNGVNNKQALGLPGAQCRQCENRYYEACVQQGLRSNVASDTWFCSNSCQEVYVGLQAQIGFMNWLSDGCNWSLLKCIDGDQKAHSALHFLALRADCNSESVALAALTKMEECFSHCHMQDLTTGVDVISQPLYSWSSKYARVNYSGFYTVVLQDDTFVALASIRIHGVKVAEIPFVAAKQEIPSPGHVSSPFNAIEHMLKSLKVEKRVISAIPS